MTVSEAPNARRRLPLLASTQAESHHRTKGLLRLTMACNEKCPFCNVPVEDYPRPTPPEAEVMRELEEFIAGGERTLTISGGEPTLYKKRLIAVVQRAREAGVPFVELQTNAVLIDDEYAKALGEAGLTSAFVSLLSHQAALHDELAGLEGAFEPCLRGIDALSRAGVKVTLNPVIAFSTQHLVADYVDFVAQRLPDVRVISLSAVQPHGRAANALELLPDYAILAREVPRARARAEAHGIVMVNPYCGLPLCIGWNDASDRAVEAIEALEARRAGRRHQAHGLENRGNKQHGVPCRGCALRTRCGGAWHAYWQHRAGSGIAPPVPRVEPFFPDATKTPQQEVIAAPNGLCEEHFQRAQQSNAPTLWLLSDRLRAGEAARLRASGVTDLALFAEAPALIHDRETLSELRALKQANELEEPQGALRVSVGLTKLGSFSVAYQALQLLSDVRVDAVRILVRGDARHEKFASALRAELGLDVSLGAPP
jgi:MoaA/NifB/PqqE/SkfB family radical SAM enzyme